MSTSSSVFISADEARQSPRRDITIHDEARGIESAILDAVNLGLFETTVLDGTPMTNSSVPPIDVWTVDASTDILFVPNHGLGNGDTVTVSSTMSLPSPLLSTSYYYAIYVDVNHIKLASSFANAIASIPINIDITSGVVNVSITNSGSGYIQPPIVTPSGGSPNVAASFFSYLSSYGNVISITNSTNGSGYVSTPTVNISAVGSGAVAGAVTYQVVSISLQNAGTNYHLGDVLSVSGGTGTAATARVTGVDSFGTILGISLINPGSYSVLPSTTNVSTTVTPGGGSGATLNLTMGILSVAISNGGTGYTAPPRITINSITGTGAIATSTIYGGSVSSIIVTDPGHGYLNVSSITIDSGTGATALAMLQPTIVQSIALTDGGSGYTDVPTVTVLPFGANATVGSLSMTVVNVQLTSGGRNYSVGDSLLVSGGIATINAWIRVASIDENGAILTYVLENGGSYTSLPGINSNPVVGGNGTLAAFNLIFGVSSIGVASGGTGYTIPPIITIDDPVNGGGTAKAQAVITSGSISNLFIYDSGFNYSTIPNVSITNGSGATASAFLNSTTLNTVNITSGGSGYTAATVTIAGGGASSNATATASIFNGAVSGITVTYGGSGYTSLPNITITGNGTGATATSTLTPTSVSGVVLNASGSGYNAPPQVIISGNATADSILSGTGIDRIVVTNQGSNYVTDPIITLSSGPHQSTTPLPPVMASHRAFTVSKIAVVSAGQGYQSAPTLVISPPYYQTGIPASANATIGAGSGTFMLIPYSSSKDYFKIWKGMQPSNPLLSRPYTDQMDTVIAYFTNLGYNINRITNPTTNATIAWKILW